MLLWPVAITDGRKQKKTEKYIQVEKKTKKKKKKKKKGKTKPLDLTARMR